MWIVIPSLVPLAAGHGAMYIPMPRNSMDRDLPEFQGGKEEGEKRPETVSKIGALAQEASVIVVFGAHPQKCNCASVG